MLTTEEMLIVGGDIAGETHFAGAVDFRGIELGKLLNSVMM